MTVAARRPAGVPAITMAALMLAVFTVSLGYGVVLPLLPYLIERLVGAGVQAAQVSRNTGLLTGVYTLALFLFAPAWGRASDRHGRRGVLLLGLVGFGVTMLAFSFFESLTAVYAERFLSGMFASAVTPVASAAIGDLAPTAEGRARRLALVSMAGIAGFLLGPTLGVFITRLAPEFFTIARPAGSLAVPLAATAVLAFLVGVTVAFAVPKGEGGDRQRMSASASSDGTSRIVTRLLVLAFFVEMYGFPLTIYLLSGWLARRFPGVDPLGHDFGHLWYTLLGFKGNPHLNPIHIASNVLIVAGFFLLSAAWRVLYRAQKEGKLATTGPYAYVRHPQYVGFILIMFGFLLQWPTLVTLVMFPILVTVYVRLAHREEREVRKDFGPVWDEYAARTPGFIPRLGQRRTSGGERSAHA